MIRVSGALALLFGGDPVMAQRACTALESQLVQLQAGGISRGEAARVKMLRGRMARAGCGYGGQSARSAARSEPRTTRTVVGRSPSRTTRTAIGRSSPRSHALRRPERAPQSEPGLSAGGTYRTMCVRSCDGFYFPVSFSTTRDRFSDDAEICARMCPDADAGLYVHSAGEGPENMTSLDGAAYSDLPAAFSYRERFDPGCSCGSPAAGEATAERGDEQAGEAGQRFAARPRSRPAPAEDPETAANRRGGFALTHVEPGAFASAQVRFGRPVRHVGPRYGGEPTSQLLVRPISQ